MNENYKQNNFILFFLVKVQYIKKKPKQNKHTKQESKETEQVLFFFVSKIGNHF